MTWTGQDLMNLLLAISFAVAMLSAFRFPLLAAADSLYFAWLARKTPGFQFRRSHYSRRFMVLRAGETFLCAEHVQRWNEPQQLQAIVAWLQTRRDQP